jgi:hypothetical protein
MKLKDEAKKAMYDRDRYRFPTNNRMLSFLFAALLVVSIGGMLLIEWLI